MYQDHVIYINEAKSLKKGDTVQVNFNADSFQNCKNYLFKLRLSGDVGLHTSWEFEGGYPLLYRDIDDALCEETHHSQYSLRIKENKESYKRSVYYKVQCPLRITPQFPVPHNINKNCTFSLFIKGESFYSYEKAEVVFERYFKKTGRDIRDINDAPDEIITLPLPNGTYDWKQLTQTIAINDDTACILVYITVGKTDGEILLEDPTLKNVDGHNVIPQFTNTNAYHPFLNWLGENLSHKEWTDVEITINGTTLPTANLYQRCHLHSENEIPIPTELVLQGENTVCIKNVSDYHSPYPYILHKVELLSLINPKLSLVCCQNVAYNNQRFAIMVSTNQDNLSVSMSTNSTQLVPDVSNVILPKKGLHVLGFKVGENATDITINLSTDDSQVIAHIDRIVNKQYDNVLTGTGDAIYIPQDTTQMEEFLAWYLSNHLGNFITFRPVYRWSGTRTKNSQMWKRIAQLCNDMGIFYCHIIDGRELPGINANPTKAELEGDYFVGNQGHERDGAYYYWRQRDTTGNNLLFYEVSKKIHKHEDFTYSNPIEYTSTGIYNFFNPETPRDMHEAAQQFVNKSRVGLAGIKRHTGPSVLFKYFFEAGLEVGGAELMYGPQEVILSTLRGASLAYNRKEYAAHLAVQWSSTPHDTIERYRRFQLALFVCYIQGVHHINTEEGLYRMEEYFSSYDRFSQACQSHSKVQRDFTKFVMTHTRRGRMNTSIGILHGNNDGWVCFTRRNVWAQNGDDWAFSMPEESWDLLKVFYPDSVLNAIYSHPCPNEPQGFYSRTPYGTVDIVPVEAEIDVMKQYCSMAFLGYNTATYSQIDTLKEYVRNGGTLLLALPHLFSNTDRVGGNLIDNAQELIGVTLNGFLPTVDGITLGDITLSSTAHIADVFNGRPLVIENSIGDGKVTLVNTREYPAALGGIYERLLKQLGELSSQNEQTNGTLMTDDTVGFSIYDREDGHRIIYAININWWDNECDTANAQLHLSGQSYKTAIKREVITIFTILDDICIKTNDNETDVISIKQTDNGFILELQGNSQITLTVYCPAQSIKIQGFEVEKNGCGSFNIRGTILGEHELNIQYL